MSTYRYEYVERGFGFLKILSICIDVEDIFYTHKLINYIREYGYLVDFEIIFLNKFSSEADLHLRKLRDKWFLRRFDQIWIFDFNNEYSITSLSYTELCVIERVVSEGRVLIIGSKTYLDNYCEFLNKILSVEYVDVENSGVYSIKYMNKTYSYNSTQTSYLILRNIDGFVKGFFEPLNQPAIVFNKYGRGVSVTLAFNPVEQAVRYNNLDMYRIAREIVIDSMNYLGERRGPPLSEEIYYTLFQSINLYNTLFFIFLAIVLLETTSLLGILPYRFVKIFLKPLVLTKIIRIRSYSEFIDTIIQNPGITIFELSNRLKVPVRRVKVVLAILESRRIIESSIDNDSGRTVFRIRKIQS